MSERIPQKLGKVIQIDEDQIKQQDTLKKGLILIFA